MVATHTTSWRRSSRRWPRHSIKRRCWKSDWLERSCQPKECCNRLLELIKPKGQRRTGHENNLSLFLFAGMGVAGQFKLEYCYTLLGRLSGRDSGQLTNAVGSTRWSPTLSLPALRSGCDCDYRLRHGQLAKCLQGL